MPGAQPALVCVSTPGLHSPALTHAPHEHADVRDSSGDPVFALPGTTFGPALPVHVHVETAGTYRLWGQFRLGNGNVLTVPFTVAARGGHG